ncbi:MAG: phosphoribosylanthranilate isomerase [Candidatus Omnitrophota bacterium]
MAKIKFCGITNIEDAGEAARLRADYIGFILYKGSKRHVDAERVAVIARTVPPGIGRVGVFVNEEADTVLSVARNCGLDTVQFHGDEAPEYCGRFRGKLRVIKAFRIRTADDLRAVDRYDVDYYLFDTFHDAMFGGTGTTFNWSVISGRAFKKPIFLSGGLNPENVCDAIKTVSPFCVDIAGGIERMPGKKDHEQMRRFAENVRGCDNDPE